MLRGLGLFALVNALAERLRGVFVPYFRHLLDLCIAYLSGISAGEGTKKKRRRKSAGANEAVDSSAEPTPAPEAWRLRLRVLRALQRAMLYDAPPGSDARLLDEACFERLLPALAAQLPEHPPEGEAAHAVEAEATADAALEASLQSLVAEGGDEAAPGTDAFGRAVVACLSQLAVAAGSDAQWKPLNYALLMATRATEPRTRLLALYGVSQLQARLAEEYLVLLPETLPYLAELLEDGEHEVEAGATELLRRLEKLSGESLAEYLKP